MTTDAMPTTEARAASPTRTAAPPALDADRAPPPWLPGRHFAAALAFFACGAAGLFVIAPDLARGAFFMPRVVAVVHLFVLGWIVLSIFGALCQFLPVAVGRPLKWGIATHVAFVAHVGGVALFVTALVAGSQHLLHVGAALLSTAFLVFAANLAATLASAAPDGRSLTWWALAGADLFLVVTPGYGVALALNLHGDLAIADRFTVVAAHAHVAIVGFVLLVVVGVAHRLLPMFLLSHGASERPAWAAVVMLFAGALVLATPFGGGARFALAGVLAAGGVVAFLAQAALFFRHRKRRAIDPGMRLAAVGLVGLALSAALAPFALTRGLTDPHLLATYFVALIGALSLFVAGHYYKIVPFIVWYHRFGPLVGKRKVPKVAELYSEAAARVDAALLVSGWLGLAAATYAGSAGGVRAAALVFTAGALLEIFVIARIAQRRAT